MFVYECFKIGSSINLPILFGIMKISFFVFAILLYFLHAGKIKVVTDVHFTTEVSKQWLTG